MTAVHQFVPVFAARSAISNHAREASRAIRSLGLTSEIWVDSAWRAGRNEIRNWRDYQGPPAGEPTWLLYQLSTGSPMADFLRGRPEPMLVNYHNVTPAPWIAAWEPSLVSELVDGRHQLRELAGCAELGIADSAFNGAELVEAGYRRTTVVPVLVDLEALGAPRDSGAGRRLEVAKRGGGADWLFVGRVAPNKCQHQLVKAFAVYRRLFDARARLWLVGGSSSLTYLTALERFVSALGLSEAVTLTGSVPQGALVEHYRRADVFVCLSEHEGFCVPLLEAMWHRVPIVALGAAAVPETLGPAGVLLPARSGRQPSPAVVAAAVHRVVTDGALRDALVAAGAERVEQFSLPRTRRRFVNALSQLGGPR